MMKTQPRGMLLRACGVAVRKAAPLLLLVLFAAAASQPHAVSAQPFLGCPTVVDSGFESPALGEGTSLFYQPTSGWDLTGNFFLFNPSSPGVSQGVIALDSNTAVL